MAKKPADPDMINDVEEGPQNVSRETFGQTPEPEPAPIPGLINGRVVHYVLDQDKHRTAHITAVVDAVEGIVNLYVLYDGENDGRSALSCSEWKKNVEYSEFAIPGTWHFIEKA